MPTRINIKFKEVANSFIDWEVIGSILGDYNLVTQIPPLRIFTILVEDSEVEETLEYFRSLDEVERAKVAEVAHADTVRLDPIPSKFYVNDLSQFDLIMMNAYDAHKYQQGDESVVVAVVDTGLYEAHVEFENRGIEGYSIDDVNDPCFLPGHYHGTACASCISPVGAYMAAVAPNVTIMAVRASVGTAASFTSDNIATAITIAVGHGADIISYSIGGSVESDTINDAVTYALNEGLLFVHSAGNTGDDNPSTPVRDDIISVGSIDKDWISSDFTSYGVTVNVVAPGEDILMAGIDGYTSYVLASGTSFSCPHVAAICALIKSENFDLTNQQITDIVCQETTGMENAEFVAKFTNPNKVGCANALKAVLKARSMKLENTSESYPYIIYRQDNVDETILVTGEGEDEEVFLETKVTIPFDAEVGVYGADETVEIFQGENYIYRGPKHSRTKNVVCSENSLVTTVAP